MRTPLNDTELQALHALRLAIDAAIASNTIGEYAGGQSVRFEPSPNELDVDDHSAVMSRQSFEALATYSSTVPSGVYVGKCWKALRQGEWYLMWYGYMRNPDGTVNEKECSVNRRPILVRGPTLAADLT